MYSSGSEKLRTAGTKQLADKHCFTENQTKATKIKQTWLSSKHFGIISYSSGFLAFIRYGRAEVRQERGGWGGAGGDMQQRAQPGIEPRPPQLGTWGACTTR